MRNPEMILKNLFQHSKDDKDYIFERLYRNLYNKEFYLKAMTDRQHNELEDKEIEELIEQLKSEQYRPQAIQKNKELKVTLKHCPKDILVQRIIRMLLTAIYDPIFNNYSYGFRQNQGCHDALMHIKKRFTGYKWFIKGDITSLYETMDHHIIIDILRKKIKDEKFIRLICKFLRAGYLEEWIYNKTYSQTPYGKIINPILTNIYLSTLDTYISEQLSHTTKTKKIAYVRYANVFLAGINGTKKESLAIKDEIENHVKEQLKLQLSTEITDSKKSINFLEYEISAPNEQTIKMTMPKEVVQRQIIKLKIIRDINERPWRAISRKILLNKTDIEILKSFNEQIEGLYNYYKLAKNVSAQMNTFYQIMKWSLIHTLAAKHKMTIKKTLKKYHYLSYGEDKDKTIRVIIKNKKGDEEIVKFYHKGFHYSEEIEKELQHIVDRIKN